jgi:hypothetical protein
MSYYLLKRTDHGGYVAQLGSENAYTSSPSKACWFSLEKATARRLRGEIIVSLQTAVVAARAALRPSE